MLVLRQRFTVGRMMATILCLGLVFHLSLTAWRVYRGRRPHIHTAIIVADGSPAGLMDLSRQPFWRAYWRGLLGLSWKEKPLCRMDARRLLEKCDLANPEIGSSRGLNTVSWNETEDQVELHEKLKRTKGLADSYADRP